MNTKDSRVVVLVAVYNGEKYLRELIDSILNGSYDNIKIVLSDDKSTDSSISIIEEYAEKYENVEHYVSGKKFGSAAKHFMHLLSVYKNEDYVMLCDQDDVWDNDKVEITLNAMKDGENGPRLVHTDSVVTDETLAVISPSFHKMFSMKEKIDFPERLIENNVQGSTAMLNRSLLEKVAVEDDRIVMHDWFIAIVASGIGDIVYLPKPTMKYRQHTDNVVGAAEKPESFSYIFRRLKTDIGNDILKGRRQAMLVLERIGDRLSSADKAAVKAYSECCFACKAKRLHSMKKYGIIPNSFLKKIKFLIWG